MNSPYAAPVPPAPAPPAPETVTVPIDTLIEKYREVRDRKKELVAEQAAVLEPFNKALAMLEAVFLDYLNRGGVESARTKNGTAYKVHRKSYKIVDPLAFRTFVESLGLNDMYENRLATTVLEDYLSKGNPLPPGLDVSEFIQVNVKKS